MMWRVAYYLLKKVALSNGLGNSIPPLILYYVGPNKRIGRKKLLPHKKRKLYFIINKYMGSNIPLSFEVGNNGLLGEVLGGGHQSG